MSEQTSGKKVVDRNVAIALGIICILLAVVLVGTVVYYQSRDSQIQTLTSQNNELQDIVFLEKSTIWVNETFSNPAGYYSYWTRTADYAGFVLVDIQISNTTDNYVQVIYSSHGVNYDNKIDVVAGGGARFPILPSTSIEIRVGNTSPVASSKTLTIIYYY